MVCFCLKTQFWNDFLQNSSLKWFTSLWNGLLLNSASEWFSPKLGFGMVSYKTQLWNVSFKTQFWKGFLQNSAWEWFSALESVLEIQIHSSLEWFAFKLSFGMVSRLSSKTRFQNGFLQNSTLECFFQTQFWKGFFQNSALEWFSALESVLRIRIRMFLGLPDPDTLDRGADPDPSHIMF
jgi:hypothetical protein